MTSPIMNARLRPMIEPILPPVTISIAMTSVYRTMAVWIPVIVVPRSSATVAIETFMTELSSAIRNWPAQSVSSTVPATLPAFSTALSLISLLHLRLRIGQGTLERAAHGDPPPGRPPSRSHA